MRGASGEPAGRSLSQLVFDRARAPSSSTSADASPRRMRAKTFVSESGTFGSARGFPIWLADARSENRLAVQRLAACTTWRRCSGLSSIEAWPSRSSCRAAGTNSREDLDRSAGGHLSGTSAARAISMGRARSAVAVGTVLFIHGFWGAVGPRWGAVGRGGAEVARRRSPGHRFAAAPPSEDPGTLGAPLDARAAGSSNHDASSSREPASGWASLLNRLGRWRGRSRRWTSRRQEGGDG